MKRLTLISFIFFVASLSGCAITKDGVRIPGTGPSQADVQGFNERFKAASESAAKEIGKQTAKNEIKRQVLTDDEKLRGGVKLIAIGTTGAFTELSEKQISDDYDNYEKMAKEKGLKRSMKMTREWAIGNTGGVVSVKYHEIPLLGARQITAFVFKDMREMIGFPSTMGAFMVGSSGDLVAAKQFENIGIWITKVLCSEKKPDFSSCSKLYRPGLYQAVDGREIDNSLKVIDDGNRIDIETFKPIQTKE